MVKADFIRATKGMMNSIREWNGYRIQNVGWVEGNPWAIVSTDKFNSTEVGHVIACFHTREELWQYLKSL